MQVKATSGILLLMHSGMTGFRQGTLSVPHPRVDKINAFEEWWETYYSELWQTDNNGQET
jgi:hypothetical protein